MKIAMNNRSGVLYSPEKMGFILLEVLVSVMILTVGLLAVLGAFSSSSKIIGSSERYQIALQLAEQKMYEIETTPDEELRDYGHGTFGDKYPEYSWEYDTEEEQSEFYSNEGGFILEPDIYKKIIVNVFVKERGKTQNPVTLVTYKTSQIRFLI